uniref:taste receptor type 2 member 1-like n=1 Tax=Podarcis muralis TaxID=64176 RepID=UPI00109F26E3|nr:taste receptor type 2 member 1-like [Podarcis muralis]
MSTLFELFGFILLVIETLIGMMGNGFIAIVNFIDWQRSRKLSPADMILSCLSFCRFAFHAFAIQNAIFLLFFIDTFLKNVHIAYTASWLFVNTANLWFATWLSVLYCVKIATFSHPLFLQMKQRFPGLVPWLLLGTVAFSAIITTIKLYFSWMGMSGIGMNIWFTDVTAAYSSAHAIILIFLNPKLKQESVKMLHQLKC